MNLEFFLITTVVIHTEKGFFCLNTQVMEGDNLTITTHTNHIKHISYTVVVEVCIEDTIITFIVKLSTIPSFEYERFSKKIKCNKLVSATKDCIGNAYKLVRVKM